jgi:hypothetical protein
VVVASSFRFSQDTRVGVTAQHLGFELAFADEASSSVPLSIAVNGDAWKAVGILHSLVEPALVCVVNDRFEACEVVRISKATLAEVFGAISWPINAPCAAFGPAAEVGSALSDIY